ncbi:MAG: amidohydrolase family protein, partial [Desulfobacterales bacterium]
MIIDFHTHIFPKAIRENRQKYFPNESAFKLLYSSPGSKLVGATEIVDSMDDQGVDKSVVFGFPWKTKEIFQVQNDYIMEVVDRYPDRLIGLCCFDPSHREAVPETERCIKGGLSGIGEIAFYESGIDDGALDNLSPLMEICRDRDLPFLIHTNEPVGHIYPGKTLNTLKQIYDLIKRFPENKIVLAHWGGGIFFFNLLKKDVKERLENVYFDTAASPFLYDPRIYRYAKEIAGLDKILFGSDFPLLKPARYFKEL